MSSTKLMKPSYMTNCVNCGKQIFLDGSDQDEQCYWCHKPALKKEGPMAKVKKIHTRDSVVELDKKELVAKVKCPVCHQTMIVLKWNKKQDIITCDNVYCTNYRQPAGNIPLGDVDAEDKSSPVSGKV